MGTPELPSYSRTGMPGVLSRSADPQEVTAGGSRQTFDTSWQPLTINDQQVIHRISRLEASCHVLQERLALVEKEQGQGRVWSECVDHQLQFLKSWHSQHAAPDHYKPQQTSNPDPPYQEGHRRHEEAFPGGVTQKELQENEELKKLKEENKELNTRLQELLSKVMGMHEKSENINDPSRLSAVLAMYEMLRLRDWEKIRTSPPRLTFQTGRSIIKKLFEACEKDIQQRTAEIFQVIGIPPLNDDMTKSKQGLMQAIRSVFRYSYYENDSEFYSKIVMKSGIETKTDSLEEFALQCCKTYCLLLLQEPPVEAVWEIEESSWQDLEHVHKKGRGLWRNPVCLWPIMKRGEQVIVKGVVWESQLSTYSHIRS